MDNKSFQFSASNTHNNDHYLRQLNMLSHTISKPITKRFTFNYTHYLTHPQLQPPPPVFTVTKNEFKDVVQQLTGLPSHQLPVSTPPPPPIQKPKPPSTRLQRFRPPPLEQISNRAPPQMLLNGDVSAVPRNAVNDVVAAPLVSPELAPLPSVRVAAESPITAYLRFLENSVSPSLDPLWSPSILFSPSWGEMGFPQVVPSPGAEWKGL